MTYLIKKWFLPDEMKEEYHTEVLDDLSKVNIFIGPNNSGKSWFIRRLISLSNEMISPLDFDIDKVNYFFNEYLKDIRNILAAKEFPDYDSLIEKTSKLKPTKFITTNSSFKEELYNRYKNAVNVSPMDEITDTRGRTYRGTDNIFNIIRNSTIAFLQQISDFAESNVRKKYEFDKIYIPVLRGLRGIEGEINRNFYKDRTFRDYFRENKLPKNPDIFTGLEMYERVDNLGRGNEDERTIKKDYEQLLSKYFFEGKKIELTSRISKDVVYVKIGNEKEYPIYELGDGIQQLIIITFPLFDKKDKDVLAFIEEPELYLHPGLQRTLLELLSSNEFGNLQTFVTTHSNHFLDMTLDFDKISVYRFSKEIRKDENSEIKVSFNIENTSNENLNLLECLGVKNSSVMLTNCTVWVEGITDRMYIRKYLEVYQKHLENEDSNAKIFEEDKHYSFVEYSGNNITHWSFLDKDEEPMDVEHLCGKLFLISDKDEKKVPRHEELEENLGDRYHCLKSREIENLITPEVLFEVVKEYEDGDYNLKIPHSQNSYKNRYMGKYIEKHILKDKSQTTRKNKEHPYKSKSGTIKDKLAFAQKAIKHINQIEDMSDEAIELCKKLHKFIKSNNS